jgi:hypothetical protein
MFLKILFKINIIFIGIILTSIVAPAQCLELVAEKDIETMNFDIAKQVKVKLSNNKAVGTYLSISPLDEINSTLKSKNISPKDSKIIISFESFKEVKYYTYSNFANEVVAIPPYIIIQKSINYRAGDTVKYYTKDGKQTNEVDLTGLTNQTFSVMQVNLKLQFANISAEDKKNYFTNCSLIFPTDSSPNNWLYDVKKMKIYMIKE